MSARVCQEYVNIIKNQKVKYIYGYASSIFLLAKFVLENNIHLTIMACFPTSEILTEFYRKTIENAFHCAILNGYGARDGGIGAVQLDAEYFEVIYNSIAKLNNKDQNNVGKALLTDIYNYAMPFINYQLGDELQIDDEKNKSYTYNGQIINNVLGRTSDILRLENGRVLTGPGFTILFKDLPVEAYTIEKIGPNSILCTIKKLSGFGENDERVVLSTMKKQMGEDCEININYVEKFTTTNSGKRGYFFTN